MTRSSTLSALAFAGVTGCSSTPAIDVPDVLRPAATEQYAMTAAARGVQIYECRARKDGAGFEWAFVAPEAELFDARSRSIGRHGAGPFWQAHDGSRIEGALKARADAPTDSAIPWVLLTAKSTGVPGAFSGVTSVQRVNTAGGVAPAAPCTAGLAGTAARVPYTADYRFFTVR